MASMTKHTDNGVYGALLHNTREMPHPPSNEEIDPSRSHRNYHIDDHGESAREAKDYYNERMREVYHYNRSDVKTCVQWVCTAPADLPNEEEPKFFQETYNYLNSIYGEKNCILCVVHYDEGIHVKDPVTGEVQLEIGRPHLHYMAIPVVENSKYGVPNSHGNLTKMSQYEEKVCCDEKVTLLSMQLFHPEYQKWIDDAGIHATVYKGGQGINLSVDQLKTITKETGIVVTDLIKERDALLEQVKSLESKTERDVDAWGRDRNIDVWDRGREERTWNR